MNFGIIYGISGWGLAKQLDCDPAEAHDFIKKYLDVFSEIREFMEDQKEFAREKEYVETLFGRKCYTPNINNKMGNVSVWTLLVRNQWLGSLQEREWAPAVSQRMVE